MDTRAESWGQDARNKEKGRQESTLGPKNGSSLGHLSKEGLVMTIGVVMLCKTNL